MARRLVTEGHAYFCYCTPETLQRKRDAAEQDEGGWRYDRTCLSLSAGQTAALDAAGAPRAIRFKVPDDLTRFDDLVHGPVEFQAGMLEDFILLRSDGNPTYHLSVVVDDIDMAITHVIRGDDHVSNTPKHVLLFKAFGAAVPAFAHVPLILGPDKKRLSKRHGATSVLEYRHLGYLPEAMLNFLALLGWSPGDDRELFSRDELIERFTLEGISGGNAVFNPAKLDWFNQQHMNRLPPGELAERLEPALREAGLWRDEYRDGRREWLGRVIDLVRPRARRLDDLVRSARPFLAEQVVFDPEAVSKHLGSPDLAAHMSALRDALSDLEPFDAPSIEARLRDVAARRSIKAAALIHAARVAATGEAVSPSLFDVLSLLGRETTIGRLRALERFLGDRASAT
jgi:glutamyl-tRNA synthetase